MFQKFWACPVHLPRAVAGRQHFYFLNVVSNRGSKLKLEFSRWSLKKLLSCSIAFIETSCISAVIWCTISLHTNERWMAGECDLKVWVYTSVRFLLSLSSSVSRISFSEFCSNCATCNHSLKAIIKIMRKLLWFVCDFTELSWRWNIKFSSKQHANTPFRTSRRRIAKEFDGTRRVSDAPYNALVFADDAVVCKRFFGNVLAM